METISEVTSKFRALEPELIAYLGDLGDKYQLDKCWIGACSVRTILRMILTRLNEDQLLAFILKEVQDVTDIRRNLQ